MNKLPVNPYSAAIKLFAGVSQTDSQKRVLLQSVMGLVESWSIGCLGFRIFIVRIFRINSLNFNFCFSESSTGTVKSSVTQNEYFWGHQGGDILQATTRCLYWVWMTYDNDDVFWIWNNAIINHYITYIIIICCRECICLVSIIPITVMIIDYFNQGLMVASWLNWFLDYTLLILRNSNHQHFFKNVRISILL